MNHNIMHTMFLNTGFFYPLIALIVAYAVWEPLFEWLEDRGVGHGK